MKIFHFEFTGLPGGAYKVKHKLRTAENTGEQMIFSQVVSTEPQIAWRDFATISHFSSISDANSETRFRSWKHWPFHFAPPFSFTKGHVYI